MKPTCEASASANGPVTDQKRGSFSAASLPEGDAERSTAPGAAIDMLAGIVAPGARIHAQTMGISVTSMQPVINLIAEAKPNSPLSQTSAGASATPPMLAPLRATLMAR